MADGWRLGLIPLDGDVGMTHTVKFADALGAVLKGPCTIHRAADYRALVAALNQRLVHFAWLPPLVAARAVRAASIVPVGVIGRSGATSYMTGLLARKGGTVKTVADLKRLRVAWVDRDSASGYVVIRAALSRQGVSLTDAFSEEVFLRSHAAVARAVQEGRVDVGATCFNFVPGSMQIARGYAGEAGLPLEEVHMITHAGPIPSDIFAAQAGVAAAAIARITEELFTDDAPLSSLGRALMHADAFARPTPAHVEMLRVLYETVLAPRSNPVRHR
jgi:phosphate/phosphite/phosphonate ABC transporter binding protein